MGVHWKIWFIWGGGGGFTKNKCIGEDCLKRGGLRQFADLRGGLAKKKAGVYEGSGGGGMGVLIPQCRLWICFFKSTKWLSRGIITLNLLMWRHLQGLNLTWQLRKVSKKLSIGRVQHKKIILIKFFKFVQKLLFQRVSLVHILFNDCPK